MAIEDNTIKIPTQVCTHNYKEIYTHIPTQKMLHVTKTRKNTSQSEAPYWPTK